MKTQERLPLPTTTRTDQTADCSKLVSLLALATGAVAMPQTGNADIIYTDLSSNPGKVGFATGYSDSFAIPNLPGIAQLTFHAHRHQTRTASRYSQTVTAAPIGGKAGMVAAANGFAPHLSQGAPWNQGLASYYSVAIGKAIYYNHFPDSYDQQYLAWEFTDTVANAERYGWVKVSLSNGNLVLGDTQGPNVTIWAVAYDNTGAKPAMGQVPEPGSLSLVALGALALGAQGVRFWRRNRAGAGQS